MLQRTRPHRRTLHRRRAGASIAVAAALALTACSGSDSSTPKDAALVVYAGQSGDFQPNFNPYSPVSLYGANGINEPLFFINTAAQSDPVPLLGTSYEWNDDGTRLDVELRDGVEWSDGKPFTAKDVVFTFGMLKEHPAVNGIGFEGEVEAAGDHRVTFTFPATSFMSGPDVLSRIWIVPEHVWSTVDPAKDTMRKPVGTGPFLLDDFKPQAFTVKANTGYWGGEPALKKVRYLSLSGNQGGVEGLASKTIDWYTGPVPSYKDVPQAYPGYEAYGAAQNQVVLGTCANEDLGCTGPQTDPAVRKALYHALNRDQLNSLAFQNTGQDISPAFALPSQSSFVADGSSNAPGKPDLAASDRLLTDAGWAKGSGGVYQKDGKPLRLTLDVVAGYTDDITAAETISSQAAKAGIEITVVQSAQNEWTDKKKSGKFQLNYDKLYQGAAPDPYYVYNTFFKSKNTLPVGERSGSNFSRYSNETVDVSLEKLSQAAPADKSGREPHYAAIQKEIAADMPYVPVIVADTMSIWNTQKYSGWPSGDSPAAFPAVWSKSDAVMIYKSLKVRTGN